MDLERILGHNNHTMPDEYLEQFMLNVLADDDLQRQLRDITDLDEFIAAVLSLGKSNGYEFGRIDVEEAIRNRRRAWIER